MTFGAEYYTKELLLDSIRFNTQFFELSIECSDFTNDILEQFFELDYLLDVWKSKQYGFDSTIEHAQELLCTFSEKHNAPELTSNLHLR